MSASGRPRWSQWYRWIFRAGVYTGSIWFCICSTVRPHDASQRRLSSLPTRSARISSSSRSSICTSTGGNTTPCHRLRPGLLKGSARLRRCVSPARRWRFRLRDEWREAPRLINRLDTRGVVLYRRQPVAVPPVPGHSPVYVTATSTPSGPVPAAIPVLPLAVPAGRRGSGSRPAARHAVSACSTPDGAGCRNGSGGSARRPSG